MMMHHTRCNAPHGVHHVQSTCHSCVAVGKPRCVGGVCGVFDCLLRLLLPTDLVTSVVHLILTSSSFLVPPFAFPSTMPSLCILILLPPFNLAVLLSLGSAFSLRVRTRNPTIERQSKLGKSLPKLALPLLTLLASVSLVLIFVVLVARTLSSGCVCVLTRFLRVRAPQFSRTVHRVIRVPTESPEGHNSHLNSLEMHIRDSSGDYMLSSVTVTCMKAGVLREDRLRASTTKMVMLE